MACVGTNPPFRVQAVYSWGGDDHNDLGFLEGDIIDVTDVAESGWWYGQLLRNKMAGYFPSNYVKQIAMTASSSRHSLSALAKSQSKQSLSSLNGQSVPRSASSRFINTMSAESSRRNSANLSSPKLDQSPQRSRQSSPDKSSYQGFSRLSSATLWQSNARTAETSEEDDDIAPPAPKHVYGLNHSAKGLSSSFKDSNYSSLKYSTTSVETERSSFFGHSDFSATSAASFARHRHLENQNQLREYSEKGISDPKEKELVFDKLFNDKQSKHPRFLKKIFKTDAKGPTLDEQIHLSSSVNSKAASEQHLHHEKSTDELQEYVDVELQRCKSLTSTDRATRASRVMKQESYLVLRPHKSITYINTNEQVKTVKNDYEQLDLIPLHHVDKIVRKIPVDKFSSPQTVASSRIGSQFDSELELLRAVFVYCTERFKILPYSGMEKISSRIAPDLPKIMQDKECTAHELTWIFRIMAATLGLQTEIVLGFVKFPNEIDDLYQTNSSLVLNHSWLAVLIGAQWRFIDVALANASHPIHTKLCKKGRIDSPHEGFYFLTKPLDLIHTHVPLHPDQQHVVPPIDSIVQLCLPPAYPSFIQNQLQMIKFDNSLMRLQDFDVAEIDIDLPTDVQVTASIVAETGETKPLTQIYWRKNHRIAKIKGSLPHMSSQGTLNVHAGPIGVDLNRAAMSTLALSIPVFHKGKYNKFDFVKRYQNNDMFSQDLYVKEPQLYRLQHRGSYRFIIAQHPSNGIDSAAPLPDDSICIQAPSGRKTMLNRQFTRDQTSGSWGCQFQVREPGIWRGLILSDDGRSWCEFAEWESR
ncbi:unnamed protein product [Kuraishia capsulata CBS 1993]|uniref:SH3 domain-containing protein n=1 Tax=Kuraishia capsulata CBS 1993 TaxID=1382522 RepID=W6MWP5_9ASCO|nr:uncharacterized protein KUCA_T00003694001 [Kuraishia capsulata CBS 1993]CDK27715.1 unnamed protein product [Kuraishia capsulata CBS 1993]